MTKKRAAYTGGTVTGGGNESSHPKCSARRPAGQPVYTADGRTAGYVVGQTFRKRVEASRHMLKKPRPAWAIDVYVLDQLRAAGVMDLLIEDAEGAVTYTASLSHFERNGRTFDYGAGPQIALELRYWRVEFTGSQRFARQLGLWDAADV